MRRFHNIFGIFIILQLLASCACHQKKFQMGGSNIQDLVFPLGLYHHEITLGLKEGGVKNFNGVIQLKSERITVVGLSSFGTTVFKITEDRTTGLIETEIYIEALKKYEIRILVFYKLIREILLLRTSSVAGNRLLIKQRSPEGVPLAAEFTEDGKKVSLRLSELDEHRIPGRIELEQDNFSVIVKVVGYDL